MTDAICNIIRKRALPGLLIFDPSCRLLYFNREALQVFCARQPERRLEARTLPPVPEEITALCERLQRNGDGEAFEMLEPVSGRRVSVRASYIGGVVDGEEGQNILVLIERIMERREVDLVTAQKQFEFSRKELEVLRHICEGLPNRRIAEAMFISEYTVKNHIKKIMRRMRVSSRSEILVTLR